MLSEMTVVWVPTWIFPATNRCSTVERSLSLRPAWCRPMPNCRLCCRLVSCSQHHESIQTRPSILLPCHDVD